MAQRYSRIKRGAEYNAALESYITYLQTAGTRPRNLNTRGDYNFVPVYLAPFGAELAAETDRVQGRAQSDHYTLLAPFINTAGTGAEVANTVTAGSLKSLAGFKPARVIWNRNETKAKTVPRSAVTNQQYLKYDTDRYSCAFGRATLGDVMFDAFLAIKGILQSQTGFAVNRVSLTEENVTYEA